MPTFWRCYYHIIWTTRYRTPSITDEIEQHVRHAITEKSRELICALHALNMVPDHVHVAVSIPPKLAVSEWVRQIKGASAHHVNHYLAGETGFHWQRSYGVLTFGVKHLPFVVDYVNRQKEYHAAHTMIAYLEPIEEDDD